MSLTSNPFDVVSASSDDADPLGLELLHQHNQPAPTPSYVAQPYHQHSKKQGQYANLPPYDLQPPSYSSSATDAFYSSTTTAHTAFTQPSTEQLQYIAPPIAQPYIPPADTRNDKIQDTTASPYTTSSFSSTARIWQLPYYMSYFDVNTDELVRRLWLSFDFVHEFYLVRQGSSVPALDEFDLPTSDNPSAAANGTTITQQYKQVDLYAPFWLTTTLLFVTTVTSNIASYISARQANKSRSVDEQTVWTSDFAITSAATTTFYCYLLVWAPILYFVQRRITSSTRYTLPYIISIYGYSLSAYIPAAILAIIPNSVVRWCVIGVAGAISTLFAVRNVYNPEVTFSKQLTVLLMSMAATMLLMFSTRLYFFSYPIISIELDD